VDINSKIARVDVIIEKLVDIQKDLQI